jgi:YggT family protein
MAPVVYLLTSAIDIFIFFLLMQIIVSWLIHFEVLNTRNRFVYLVQDFTNRLCEPALRPFRRLTDRLIPGMGIDVSPIILILLLNFISYSLYYYLG